MASKIIGSGLVFDASLKEIGSFESNNNILSFEADEEIETALPSTLYWNETEETYLFPNVTSMSGAVRSLSVSGIAPSGELQAWWGYYQERELTSDPWPNEDLTTIEMEIPELDEKRRKYLLLPTHRTPLRMVGYYNGFYFISSV